MSESAESSVPAPTVDASQPLELTTGVWITLGLVALLGISQLVHIDHGVRTLPPWEDALIIARHDEQTHRFSFLGVEVQPAAGWTYLSTTDDVLADQPTFFNPETNSILTLRLMRYGTWPPSDTEVTIEAYGNITVEWIELGDRRWGKIRSNRSDSEGQVTILVMTHRYRSELNPSVREFCRAIRWLDPSDATSQD